LNLPLNLQKECAVAQSTTPTPGEGRRRGRGRRPPTGGWTYNPEALESQVGKIEDAAKAIPEHDRNIPAIRRAYAYAVSDVLPLLASPEEWEAMRRKTGDEVSNRCLPEHFAEFVESYEIPWHFNTTNPILPIYHKFLYSELTELPEHEQKLLDVELISEVATGAASGDERVSRAAGNRMALDSKWAKLVPAAFDQKDRNLIEGNPRDVNAAYDQWRRRPGTMTLAVPAPPRRPGAGRRPSAPAIEAAQRLAEAGRAARARTDAGRGASTHPRGSGGLLDCPLPRSGERP
jgi:hypothetical protein